MRVMFQLVSAILGCALMGGTMAGCTSTPTMASSPPLVSVSPAATQDTPTPQWKPEEQIAIDAVQAYLERWSFISQNLPDVDYNSIRDVAGDPTANNALQQWATWIQKGWHLVGSPRFETIYVNSGASDYQGDRYHVYGCYILSDAHLVDSSGSQVDRSADRLATTYLVLTTPDHGSRVMEDTVQEESC